MNPEVHPASWAASAGQALRKARWPVRAEPILVSASWVPKILRKFFTGSGEDPKWLLRIEGSSAWFTSTESTCRDCIAYWSQLRRATARKPGEELLQRAAEFAVSNIRQIQPGQVLRQDLVSGEITRQTVLRRPRCPVCSRTEIQRGAKRAQSLVATAGHGTSFLTRVDSFRQKAIHFSRADFLSPAAPGIPRYRRRGPAVSAGLGTTRLQSLQRCLGEAVERYSLTLQGDEPRVIAAWNDLGDLRCSPEILRPFSDKQYVEREEWNKGEWGFPKIPPPLSESSVTEWSPMQSLVSKRIVLVPTQALYLGAGANGLRVHFVADTIGCAAGPTLQDAVLSALLELVERDAVAIWWYNRLRRPAASKRILEAAAAQPWIRYLRSPGRRFFVSEITTDLGIPVYAAISHNEKGSEIALGFGCHPDRATAVAKALRELCQTSRGTMDANPADYAHGTMQYAWLRWALRANIRDEGYLVPVTAPRFEARPLRATGNLLSDCVNRLAEPGYNPLAMVATRPEIGWPAARVVCPGLCHPWHRLGIPRLFEAPVVMGLLRRRLRERELNATPFTL